MTLDRTAEFRELLRNLQTSIPPNILTKARRRNASPDKNDQLTKATATAYMQDAYTILRHIQALAKMLALIKRPYLNVEVNDLVSSRDATTVIDLMTDGASLSTMKHLSSHQRDQVDLQAKMIITRCAERVRSMEQVEKNRAELVSSKANKLLRLLPTRLTVSGDAGGLSSDFLAAHNASVTWYLNRRLAEVSQVQKEMQEERIKRQLERTRTLGSVVTDPLQPITGLSARVMQNGSWSTNSAAVSKPKSLPIVTADTSDESDDELELSQAQIQQFEEENALILREAQSALAVVQQAEARLMEISALQMELVSHLSQQAELTDQLYEDAIEAGATVGAGNKQLVEARQRQKDSRLFILVFLIGASMALLFLHNY
ncbi:hypothetical protein FS842_007072 [Serendipita sp. 407]|nr:hypothetical protein FS842_007072 [Serendipita sp. 407]